MDEWMGVLAEEQFWWRDWWSSLVEEQFGKVVGWFSGRMSLINALVFVKGWFGMWGVRSNWPLPIGHTTFINRYKYLLKKI